MSTSAAAKELGVHPRTIQRWVADGLLVPDWTTPGGHYRWDIDKLRDRIKALPQTPVE